MIRPHIIKSRRQEKRLAKKLGGRVQPGSGSGSVNKADVISKSYLCECKTTSKRQYIITLDMLEKLELEAARIGKEPLFEIEISGKRFYVVRESDFDFRGA